LNIGHKNIYVKVEEEAPVLELPGAVLLNRREVYRLPFTVQKPHYYFIIDYAKDSDTQALKDRVELYARRRDITDATIYLTNYRFEKCSLLELDGADMKAEAGFNLDLAVKDIFRDAPTDSLPLIIYVSDREDKYFLRPEGIESHMSPQSNYYYALKESLFLRPYSFYTNERFDATYRPVTEPAGEYEGRVVIKDGEAKLVVLQDQIQELTGNQYLDALALHAENRINTKNGVKPNLNYIKKSFTSHVLTPATAFFVVETKEQEEELMALQEKILNAQEELEAVSLSEPPVAVITALFAATVFCLNGLRRLKRTAE